MKKQKVKKLTRKSLSIFLAVVMMLTTCSVAFGMQVFASTWSEGSQLTELAAALKSDVVLALSDTSDTSVVYIEGDDPNETNTITNTVILADYNDYIEFLKIVDLIMEEAEFCLFSKYDYDDGTTEEMTRGYKGYVTASSTSSSSRKLYGENMYSVSNELQKRLLNVMGDDYDDYGIELFTDVVFENWSNNELVSRKIHNTSTSCYQASEPESFSSNGDDPFLTFTLEVITTDVAGWIEANDIENYEDIELQTNYIVMMELCYAESSGYSTYGYLFTNDSEGTSPLGGSTTGTGTIPDNHASYNTEDGEELIDEIDALISAIETFNDTYPTESSLYTALEAGAAPTGYVATAIEDLDTYLDETGIEESAVEVAELLAEAEYEEYTDKFDTIADHDENGCDAYAVVSATGTPATCEAAGTTDTYSCSVCGAITIEPTGIDKLDHVYDYTAEPASDSKAATCLDDGYNRYYCTYDCGTYDDVTVYATGHTWIVDETTDADGWKVTTPASCEEKGTETRTCGCGVSETKDVEATGHTFGDWVETTPATCEDKGVETRECDCGEEETRDIAALGHDYTVYVSGTEGNCSTPSNATYQCSRCTDEKEFVDETNPDVHANEEETIVSEEPTCGKDGYTYSYWACCATEDEIAALEADAIANPADGYTATGLHTYGAWTITLAATCCEEGSQYRTCTGCGYVDTQVISATGEHVDADGDEICDNDPDGTQTTDAHTHSYTEKVYTDPTYTEDGYWTYVCVCGEADPDNIEVDTGSSVALREKDLDDAEDAIDNLSFGPYDEDATADEILDLIKEEIADVIGDVDFDITDFTYVAPTDEADGSVTFGIDLSAGDSTSKITTITATINMIGTSSAAGSHVVTPCDIIWCKCICGSDSAFLQFIAKICIFFWQLFGINQYCSTWGCGGVHY